MNAFLLFLTLAVVVLAVSVVFIWRELDDLRKVVWKVVATKPNPGLHARNFLSNEFLRQTRGKL